MPMGCPGTRRIKPNISSGPSSDREDPPQQPTPYAQSRRTCSMYATSLNPRVIIGVPDRVHIPLLLNTQSTGRK